MSDPLHERHDRPSEGRRAHARERLLGDHDELLPRRTHAGRGAADARRGETPRPPCSLVTSPLFHVSGLHAAAIGSLAGGAKTVWPSDASTPRSRFGSSRASASRAGATPRRSSIACSTTRVSGEFDSRSMRLVGGGGSPIPPRLQRLAREVMPNAVRSLECRIRTHRSLRVHVHQPGRRADRGSGFRGSPVADGGDRDPRRRRTRRARRRRRRNPRSRPARHEGILAESGGHGGDRSSRGVGSAPATSARSRTVGSRSRPASATSSSAVGRTSTRWKSSIGSKIIQRSARPRWSASSTKSWVKK